MARKTLTAVILAWLLVAALATPASAQRSNDGPTLLSSEKIDWTAGSTGWINLRWTSAVQLDDVQVRVVRQPNGLTIGYPNDDDHASLMLDDVLSPNEVDFTSLLIATDPTSRGNKRAQIEISWDDDGRRNSARGWLRFTNKQYSGEDFEILTDEAAVSLSPLLSEDNWIDIGYRGLAPTTNSMQITVSGPVPVHHPQETYTSLHHDDTLDAGERDVARVWFDPERIELGLHTMTVSIGYVDTNGRNRSTAHEITLAVVADEVLESVVE